MTLTSPRVSAVNQRALLGDSILLISIALSALGAIALGFQFVQASLAWGATLALLLVAVASYFTARGSTASRLVLTTGLVALNCRPWCKQSISPRA